MKILISSQPNHRGEIAYLSHGHTEAAARRAYFEWLNKGLNPNDNEAQGGRILDGSQCTERLVAVLMGPYAEDAHVDAMTVFNWACGSLYFTPAGLLDARHFSRADFEKSNPHLSPQNLHAPLVDPSWEPDSYIDD